MVIFDIEPVPKPRMTQSDRWNERPAVMRYFAFKTELCLEVNRKRFKVKNGLNITFLLSMPKSWSKKKQIEMVGKPHQQKPDIDNLLKAFFDALLEDDCVIWNVKEIKKLWGRKGSILVK